MHVIPIVIGALGSRSKNFTCFLDQLEINKNMVVAKNGITLSHKNREESSGALGRLSKSLVISYHPSY